MVRETAPSLKLVAYERVSTARQGRSGFGLEAQRKAIDEFATSKGATILGPFTEVESGRKADRPELLRALDLARLTGATLVIAKLDRLSRNAAFLLTLRDSGVRFLACDMPEANDLTVGIMALVAQQEREAISRRTKEALGAARARGVRLGNPTVLRRWSGPDGAGRRSGSPLRGTPTVMRRTCGRCWRMSKRPGTPALRAIAREMNARGILTRRGGRWHVSTVMNLLKRLEIPQRP